MSIRLEQLTKSFDGQRVVKSTSLEVLDGELFVLLGASGSGKSTVLRLIAGLSIPDSGQVWLHGRDVTTLPPQERGIGFVFQNYSIFRHMSVAENIEFPLKIRKVAPPERARRREQLLDLVGLGGLGNRYAHQLSGGQQQRVALARALVHEPSVLLLDEPFGALDVKIRGQLRRNLKDIQRQLRVTAILVTHDQEEAFELADRVGLMERGELLEVGEPEALYARPHTLFGATFLGAGTVLVGRARDGAAQLGALSLPIPPEVEHEEDARVRVLVRPEQVAISAAPPDRGMRLLGSGTIVERSFLGALRRLRVRMPPIPGTRQASPAVYGEESLLVDAVLPAAEDPGGPEVWVSLKGWHILAPPLPRLLACDLPEQGSPAPFQLLSGLERALDARISLLALTEDADQVEALRASLAQRAAEQGLPEAEPVVRRGDAAEEIAAEQVQSLYDLLILSVPGSGPKEVLGDLLNTLSTSLLAVQGRPATFAHILICTAVGEPGKADVRVGGWLARRLGAEVTLLHVLIDGGGGGDPAPWVKAHLDAGLATLRALEVRSRTALRPARTAVQGILEEAKAGGYDLIVLGRHAVSRSSGRPAGRSRRPDFTFEILSGSGKSVLIVPPDQ
ncbi:MAG: sulfate/thiosulfate transport system ATP-binding protein [Acidobacteriota bacterium]|jgi:ABC-type Fe3+/spermidine/putrescine transport system ATPase subunit/nucleotide-binding universal stress UspA family protein|nr:sulfate/thiosulfate transport system ATP-binding protein [Acidobacteriota bacterium]